MARKSAFALVGALLICAMVVPAAMPTAVAADSPFATQVFSFHGPFGGDGYDDRNSLLGKPATRTSPGQWGGRVKLVEGAWDKGLLVTLNEGAEIVVKFDHQVMDDSNNPYGIDLLLFGNSFFSVGGGEWVNDDTNMNTCMLAHPGAINSENIKVSVSQDGESWYRYDNGPYADTMFPTQAYRWDRASEQWTDTEMDWTKPVNPNLTLADFTNISVADAIDLYDGSAGGTGFDLAESGYGWIQYVKVQGLPGFSGGEIDAFADVTPAPPAGAGGQVSTEDIVNYGSLGEAVLMIESLGTGEAAKLLSKVRKVRAGQILGQLDLEKRTEIILEMTEESLKERLPEVAPEKLFEVSPQKLFEKLPDVPTEQLVGETPPTVSSDLPKSEKVKSTPTSARYLAPEARGGEWLSFFGGSISTFTSLMLKPNKDLNEVEASIKILDMRPAGVKLPPEYPYLCLYYDISLKNIEPEDIEVARLEFKLRKEILDSMAHNKWSVLFNRWDSEAGEWVSIPTKRIGEDSEFVYYSTVVPGFSIFSITESANIPAQEFEISNLTISPAEMVTGEEAIVAAEVANLSDKPRRYTAVLWVNQMAEEAKEIKIPAGGKEPVSFTVLKKEVGEYQVRIGKLVGSFTVKEAPDTIPPEITSWYPGDVVKKANPTIGAEYGDERTGVDKDGVKLLLDGENVASEAEVAESRITYTPDKMLSEGEHTVKLIVADMAGNEVSREWTFTIKLEPVFLEEGKPAQDLDRDGLYEDINGDGKFDLYDIALFFDNITSDVVQRNAELFDFNQNGTVGRDDVRKLLVEIYKQLSF